MTNLTRVRNEEGNVFTISLDSSNNLSIIPSDEHDYFPSLTYTDDRSLTFMRNATTGLSKQLILIRADLSFERRDAYLILKTALISKGETKLILFEQRLPKEIQKVARVETNLIFQGNGYVWLLNVDKNDLSGSVKLDRIDLGVKVVDMNLLDELCLVLYSERSLPIFFDKGSDLLEIWDVENYEVNILHQSFSAFYVDDRGSVIRIRSNFVLDGTNTLYYEAGNGKVYFVAGRIKDFSWNESFGLLMVITVSNDLWAARIGSGTPKQIRYLGEYNSFFGE